MISKTLGINRLKERFGYISTLFFVVGKKFWETDPIDTWDTINGVGLRNHYICTTLASKIMVEQKNGVIINISSFGGLKYLFNCAYGIGKVIIKQWLMDKQ